jgi:hypothetical protein
MNTTHMHLRTHTKPESVGQAGRWQSPYHDTMVDHDRHVGQLLDLLDELGIAEDTIVVYSTDNGPHMSTWPDGGMTPFRSEKNTNWEGAFRVGGASQRLRNGGVGLMQLLSTRLGPQIRRDSSPIFRSVSRTAAPDVHR